MKAKDLIAKLEVFDPEMEVCLYDHKTNVNEDCGDGSSAGIYSEFEVLQIPDDMIPEGGKPWIMLAFDNPYAQDI